MARVVATEPFACSSDVFVTSSSTWSDSSSSSSSTIRGRGIAVAQLVVTNDNFSLLSSLLF